MATVMRLKKSQLKPPNRVPKTYDCRVLTLDGYLDLDVSFDGITMQTLFTSRLMQLISCCWERECAVN